MSEELKQQSLSHQEMGVVQIEHPFTEAARMFAANYAAVAGLLVLAIIIVVSLLGPFLYTVDPLSLIHI